MLEILVHVDRVHAPHDYVFIEAEIPDNAVATLDVTRLAEGWRSEPPPRYLRTIGDDWARSMSSLAIAVPSVIIPEELNYLINVTHSAIGLMRIIGTPTPVIMDPRLL
jgi:hypothetical protein